MHTESHEPIEELERLVKREPEARLARRLQAVVLARRGKTALQVTEATGMCRRVVQKWVDRYNTGGVASLRGKPHPGKPPRLTPQQQEVLKEKLEAGADYDRDGVCTLRGADVQRFIEEQFGVLYHVNHVYKLLGRLGYSSLKPRPRHRKADPQAQARWREEAPPFCNDKESYTPGRSSASGSRMRPASASRAP